MIGDDEQTPVVSQRVPGFLRGAVFIGPLSRADLINTRLLTKRGSYTSVLEAAESAARERKNLQTRLEIYRRYYE